MLRTAAINTSNTKNTDRCRLNATPAVWILIRVTMRPSTQRGASCRCARSTLPLYQCRIAVGAIDALGPFKK